MTYTDEDIVKRIKIALKEYQAVAKPNNRSCIVPQILENVTSDDVEGVVCVTLDTDHGMGDYGAFIDCLKKSLGECTFTVDDDVSVKDDVQKTMTVTVKKPRVTGRQMIQSPRRSGMATVAKKQGRCCSCRMCVAMLSFVMIAIAAGLCMYIALYAKEGFSVQKCIGDVIETFKFGKNETEL
jgi:hypothetical protein